MAIHVCKISPSWSFTPVKDALDKTGYDAVFVGIQTNFMHGVAKDVVAYDTYMPSIKGVVANQMREHLNRHYLPFIQRLLEYGNRRVQVLPTFPRCPPLNLRETDKARWQYDAECMVLDRYVKPHFEQCLQEVGIKMVERFLPEEKDPRAYLKPDGVHLGIAGCHELLRSVSKLAIGIGREMAEMKLAFGILHGASRWVSF